MGRIVIVVGQSALAQSPDSGPQPPSVTQRPAPTSGRAIQIPPTRQVSHVAQSPQSPQSPQSLPAQPYSDLPGGGALPVPIDTSGLGGGASPTPPSPSPALDSVADAVMAQPGSDPDDQ